MDQTEKKINYILVNLINEIWDLEARAIITDKFKDITNKDMHIIEAVGLGAGNNVSSIARKLNVTVGTLSSAINSLDHKQYVERYRSEKDRRVVFVRLTDKGVEAYRHHENYHHQMTMAIKSKISEEELPVLFKMLDGLTEFFKGYSAKA